MSKPCELWYSDKNYQLPRELLDEFYSKIFEVATAIFGVDHDNFPVNVIVVDRTRNEPHHYEPVPYRHKIMDDSTLTPAEVQDKLDERLERLMFNINIANEDVQREMTQRRSARHEKETNPLKKGEL